MEDTAKKTAGALVLNENPNEVHSYLFEGYRTKRYGAINDKDALVVRQMQLTDTKGVTHYATITEPMQAYIPKVEIVNDKGDKAERALDSGDVVRGQTRNIVKGITNHQSKDGKSVVTDNATGLFPTGMLDGIATSKQEEIFRSKLNSSLSIETSVNKEIALATASANIALAHLKAVKSLSPEEQAQMKENAELMTLLKQQA